MSAPANAAAGPTPALLPRGVLMTIGLLVVVSLIGAATVRLSGIDIHEADAPVTVSRMLRFDDGSDGSVVVIDAGTSAVIARISGEQGFLRGALRAMARERRRSGGTPQQSFELMSHADGRLTLFDPVTHQRINLESFGPTNAGVFARLLHGSTSIQR